MENLNTLSNLKSKIITLIQRILAPRTTMITEDRINTYKHKNKLKRDIDEVILMVAASIIFCGVFWELITITYHL